MNNLQAKITYNRAAYIAQSLIPILDALEETTEPKRELKFHLKRTFEELDKLVRKHEREYRNHGLIEQEDSNLAPISGQDMYNITAKAYDFILEKQPNEIVSIVELVKSYEAGGINYGDFEVEYKPLE